MDAVTTLVSLRNGCLKIAVNSAAELICKAVIHIAVSNFIVTHSDNHITKFGIRLSMTKATYSQPCQVET